MVADSYLSNCTIGTIDYDYWGTAPTGPFRYATNTDSNTASYYDPATNELVHTTYCCTGSDVYGDDFVVISNSIPIYCPSGSSLTISNSFFNASLIISKQEEFKNRIQSNLIIDVKSRSDAAQYPGETEPERRALETLREVVTEAEFRKYLRYGFVLVKGESGKTYQVFKNKSHCRVWLNGKLIEEVCVRIKDKEVPLTDNVIAFKTMIEASEADFKKLGNVYKMAV